LIDRVSDELKNIKNLAVIGLVILAVIVLGLLVVRVVGNARTISAQSAGQDLTATYAKELESPTWTAAPSLTSTIRPTITILIPEETQTPTPAQSNTYYQPSGVSCDVAGFVADITIPGGMELAPGTVFTKTWSLRNGGTCTWNSDYQIYFYSGSQLDGPSSQDLTDGEVDPGDSVEVSVELVASDDVGNYIGYWALKNDSGDPFGIGTYGEPFYVDIYASDEVATITSTPTSCDTPAATNTPGTPTETSVLPTDTPIPDTETSIPDSETPIPDTETPIPDTETPEP